MLAARRANLLWLACTACTIAITACDFPRPRDVVNDASASDASVDTSSLDGTVDARLCFGQFVNICLETAPTNPIVVSTPTKIDTSFSAACLSVAPIGSPCVIVGTTITVDAALRASGPWPLVLIATDSITIGALGRVDVASRRGMPSDYGAGGGDPNCVSGVLPQSSGGTNGGGAGGSFIGAGGRGGNGGVGGAGGSPSDPVPTLTALRGGCDGQEGVGGAATGGSKGPGGGVVYLIAGTTIEVNGEINASGGGGSAGVTGACGGGGGGGAGGMIVFEAPTVTGGGLILANGGGGGEGSEGGQTGIVSEPGSDPSNIFAAPGGTHGPPNGGDGGNGSAGPAAGAGANAFNGTGSMGCGGGGGGGAGVVKAPATARLGTRVSPAVTQ